MTEYENTSLNIPFKKWYIIYNTETNILIQDLSYNINYNDGITLGNDVMLVEFVNKVEGKTYIESNSLTSENI